MNLTRAERESILTFNEQEPSASVYTHNAALIRKLDALAVSRPEECRRVRVCHDGQAAEYELPKGWIKVSPPRQLSEAQRQATQKALAAAQAKRNAQNHF